MTVTKYELENFGRFAADEVERGRVASLEQLVTLWRSRQCEDANAAVRQGLEEANAGLGRPLEDFMNEFRANNEVSPEA
ncbi:MAG: hypothetical protein WD070_09955 [Pirellulaceae bacterium]